MNRSILVSLVILFTACASDRPAYVAEPAPPAHESLIYIYRPAAPAMDGVTAVVELDGAKVTDLHYNGYTVVHVREGNHKVSQYWKNMRYFEANNRPKNRTDLTISTLDRHSYYFRLSTSGEVGPEGVSQVSQVDWSFSQVTQEVAQAEIVKCKREVSK